MASTYSYTPKNLLASYERLKAKEEELLKRAAASGDAAVSIMQTNSDDGFFDNNTPLSTTAPAADDSTASTTHTCNNNNENNIYNRNVFIVAATQITGAGLPDSDVSGFCFRAEQAIEMAVRLHAAHLVLLPELWSGPYFCQSQNATLMGLADPVHLPSTVTTRTDADNNKDDVYDCNNHILVKRMQLLAKLYNVVLPISIYERCNNVYYNSVVMIDADGTILSTPYRKSHIPDGIGYQEKFYFSPGDSGFKVFDTSIGKIGVAICWDQWFPEAARSMALQGADVLLYPTAIGSEPNNPSLNSCRHWQRVMQGHAAANMVPVVASNRFGTEILLHDDGGTERQRIHFYGKSFITDNTGDIIAECRDNVVDNTNGDDEQQPVVIITACIDREKNRRDRAAWGLFRDRRPDLYGILLTKDGRV